MTSQPETSEEPRRRRARIRTLPWRVIVPWALFGLAAAAAGIFATLWLQDASDDDRVEEAQRAAQAFVISLTNFSADTIDEDVAEIRSFAVGSFADEVDTFFGPDAVDAIRQAEGSSMGEIEALFVQDLDEQRASVFAVVDQTITNSVLDAPQTDIVRMEVGLIETDNGWKVQRVDIFQAPGGTLAPVGP